MCKENTKQYCEGCGEEMVCPKCHTIIEKTNSIIIRYKDTSYNGGYPNALLINPLWTNSRGNSISCATLVGDNFFHPKNETAGYTYMERGSVEEVATILGKLDVETWCRLFGFPKNRIPFAKDIKEQLLKYLENK